MHFAAGPRFLRTRLRRLSNLQRCLHSSTHGSADTLTAKPLTLPLSHKVVSSQREPAPKRPMCFACKRRCKCTVIALYKSVPHPPPSPSLLFGVNSAAARSAQSMRTRHSPQHSTLKPDTPHETRISEEESAGRGVVD